MEAIERICAAKDRRDALRVRFPDCVVRKTSSLLAASYCARDGIGCWSNFGLVLGDVSEVWAGGYDRICCYRSGGANRAYRLGVEEGPVSSPVVDAHRFRLTAVASGCPTAGLWTSAEGTWKRFADPGLDDRHLSVWKLVSDRRRALWIGTHGQSLYHFHMGRANHLGRLDGLGEDLVFNRLEDRKGAVRVVTPRGVEQFFDLPITRFTALSARPVRASDCRSVPERSCASITDTPERVAQSPLLERFSTFEASRSQASRSQADNFLEEGA